MRHSFVLAAAALAAGTVSPAASQLVQIRTLPVALADQHANQPTERGGMAGLSIAMEDRLLDPFRNPALGARLTGSRLFGAPRYFSVEEDNGNGKTLPLGGLFSGERWFGSAMLALQELQPAPTWGPCCLALADVTNSTVIVSQPGEADMNLYGSASLGRRLADGRTSVGFGAGYARLRAMEGVEFLYPASSSVRQHGEALDLRLGISRELGGDRRLEALILHNRADLTHELRFVNVSWAQPGIPVFGWHDVTRRDRTDTRGVQAGFTAPLPEEGWRAGVRATMNHLRHRPMPVPLHDPMLGATTFPPFDSRNGSGESWAYSFGIGSAREEGPVTFGVEAAYEPIWSTTEGIAPAIYVVGFGETTFLDPARHVTNRFRFDNSHLRIGAGYEMNRLGFQLGTHLRSIRYRLEQENVVGGAVRERSESWMEWKPTWGLSARFPELEVRYDGSYLTGTHRPHVGYDPGQWAGLASVILVPPVEPLHVQEARVLSHRVSVAVPIGRARVR